MIRKACFGDGPAIFQCIKAHPNELVPRSISNIMLNIDRFLVAERDGDIIGTVSWSVLPELDTTKNPSIEIQSLTVRSDLQKQNLGRQLVDAALARVAEFKPEQIIVLTFTPPFFAKMGFTPIPKEKILYKLYKGCMNCSKYDSPLTCPEVAMAYNPELLKATASS